MAVHGCPKKAEKLDCVSCRPTASKACCNARTLPLHRLCKIILDASRLCCTVLSCIALTWVISYRVPVARLAALALPGDDSL